MSRRIMALGIAAILLVMALILGRPVYSAANQNIQTPINSVPVANRIVTSPDLNAAADRLEASSEAVYNGLETTKSLVGKTEARNEAIEFGRAKASNTLEELAERTRKTQNTDQTLSKTDKKIVNQISE